MESSVNKVKSGKTKNIVLSILGVLILAALIGVLYKDYLIAQVKNFKQNPFSKGDKVYLSYMAMNGARYLNVPLYQLVKSPNSETYMVFAKKYIVYDSLLKRKDHCIGIYQHNEIQKSFFHKKLVNYFAVEVDKKLIIDDHLDKTTLPSDLKKVNDEYYVVWNFTSNKIEKRIFKN